MPLSPPMFLAASEGLGLDLVVWLVAGAIWLVSQVAALKKRKDMKARRTPPSPPASPAAPSGAGDAPTPGELAEIFRRLGADIPATPPPHRPAPPPPPPPRAPAARKLAAQAAKKRAAERIPPALAQRLAKAQQEAAAAADLAEAERIALAAIAPGVQSRAGENRAIDTATRHTGAILPRLYAMGFRMAPLPAIPMPGFDRTHHVNLPMRARLHTRRELRDALIAQTFLQPAKGLPR